MKSIITVGISASGKSTWANAHANNNPKCMVISRDEIRKLLLWRKLGRPINPGELWKLWKFKDENLVNVEQESMLNQAQHCKMNVIIADTNLNRDRNKQLESKLKSFGYDEIEYKEFPVSFDEAVRRDASRADGVGYAVLWRQYKQWYDYIGGEKYVRSDKELPTAVLVDIDGTLAHMHDRGPFEWDKVGQDKLREEVFAIVNGLSSQGYHIIFMSGRDSVCRDETIKWLDSFNTPYAHLFMRAAGDSRKDDIVKKELFFNHVVDNYHVGMVIDDRPQVVRLWTLLGLTVINVGEIHHEF